MIGKIHMNNLSQLRTVDGVMEFVDEVMYKIASQYDKRTNTATDAITLVTESVTLGSFRKINRIELYNGLCHIYHHNDNIYMLETFKKSRRLWRIAI